MKKFILRTAIAIGLCMTLLTFSSKLFADVTLTTSPLAAGNIAQGTNNTVLYYVKMDVTVSAVTVNNIQFTLTGTQDNNDLTYLSVYYNPTSASLTGASIMAGNISAAFAAPHTYNSYFNYSGGQTIAAGSSGYFIIVANVDPAATNGNTVKINGATNPVVFGFTTSPTVVNNQTDLAGTQTFLAANVTLSSSAVAASNLPQGSNTNIVYAVKMDVTTLPVTVNYIQFTLSGTYNSTDLTQVKVYFNPTAPTISGSNIMTIATANFAGPHAYNLYFNYSGGQTIAAGASGYFIIAVDVATSATNGNTVYVDGAANPVTFTYTNSPTITNNQTNIAGTQTIQAASVALSSTAVAASNLPQGSNTNIVDIVKMDVTTLPVTVNYIQFTLSGTYNSTDLTQVKVYFNPTAPTISGSNTMTIATANFAGPHAYNLYFNYSGGQTIAAGASGYFIIAVDVATSATNGNTVYINGAANPVTFTYTNSPTITNNQTNIAGNQTIQAASVALSSTAVAASNLPQGSNTNIVYAVKMDVTTLPVTVNYIQFTLSGTYNSTDLTQVKVYFNPTAPTISGSTTMTIASAGFAAPHAYNLYFNYSGSQTIAAGASGYFIIAVDVAAAGTNGNTVNVDGAANPVTFSYTNSPTITNNQTNIAGTQTIQAAGVTLTTSPVAAGTIIQGTNNNIIYAVKMDVTTLAVVVNNIQFTLTGTHDNNDLTTLSVYYNPSAPNLTGASIMAGNIAATFAAPHTYNTNFNYSGSQTIAAGASGYFIITANVDPTGTIGNTVKINGAANPVVFGFTTSPPVTNNQADIAGLQTIGSALPLTLVSFTGTLINFQQTKLKWITAGEYNTQQFDVEWSTDGLYFTNVVTIPAAGYSSQTLEYNYIHNMPVEGNNYYRLKMADIGGRFSYSQVIKINIAYTKGKMLVYPNPVKDMIYLTMQSLKNETSLFKIYNAEGKYVGARSFILTKGLNHLNWNIQNLPKGSYSISAANNDFETIKVIKD